MAMMTVTMMMIMVLIVVVMLMVVVMTVVLAMVMVVVINVGNRTKWSPIRSVIVRVVTNTNMITDRHQMTRSPTHYISISISKDFCQGCDKVV